MKRRLKGSSRLKDVPPDNKPLTLGRVGGAIERRMSPIR
jgi:hypothetical protein